MIIKIEKISGKKSLIAKKKNGLNNMEHHNYKQWILMMKILIKFT